MTDEERQKLCDALYRADPSRTICKEAADEIERLAKMMPEEMVPHKCFIPGCPVCDPPIAQGGTMTDEERQKLVSRLRRLSTAYGNNFLGKEAADEIERLERELNSILGLLYQESERRAKAEHELKLWKE